MAADGAAPSTVLSIYRAAVAAAAAQPRFAGEIAAVPGRRRVEDTRDSVTLAIEVDGEQHLIVNAAYRGATSATVRGLLETLCSEVVGVPVQEAEEHAVIAVEARLRDRSAPVPVPGIMIAERVDPAFLWLRQFAWGVARRYREEFRAEIAANTFEQPPAEAWLRLTPEERMDRVQAFADAHGRTFAEEMRVEVVRIDDLVRVTVAYRDERPARLKQRFLLELERALKSGVEASLQVYLEELKDRNAIRRIVSPREMADVRND